MNEAIECELLNTALFNQYALDIQNGKFKLSFFSILPQHITLLWLSFFSFFFFLNGPNGY